MSLDARVKTPRVGRARRRRQQLNSVERVWAYETIRQMSDKALQSTNHNTARTIVLATIQQIAAQVGRCKKKRKVLP